MLKLLPNHSDNIHNKRNVEFCTLEIGRTVQTCLDELNKIKIVSSIAQSNY